MFTKEFIKLMFYSWVKMLFYINKNTIHLNLWQMITNEPHTQRQFKVIQHNTFIIQIKSIKKKADNQSVSSGTKRASCSQCVVNGVKHHCSLLCPFVVVVYIGLCYWTNRVIQFIIYNFGVPSIILFQLSDTYKLIWNLIWRKTHSLQL